MLFCNSKFRSYDTSTNIKIIINSLLEIYYFI